MVVVVVVVLVVFGETENGSEDLSNVGLGFLIFFCVKTDSKCAF